jgi:hypothetical protein
MAKYHHFELASAAFQIAIVLASAAIITGITGMIVLAWISGLLAIVGVGITAIGVFAPHALHCTCWNTDVWRTGGAFLRN